MALPVDNLWISGAIGEGLLTFYPTFAHHQ